MRISALTSLAAITLFGVVGCWAVEPNRSLYHHSFFDYDLLNATENDSMSALLLPPPVKKTSEESFIEDYTYIYGKVLEISPITLETHPEFYTTDGSIKRGMWGRSTIKLEILEVMYGELLPGTYDLISTCRTSVNPNPSLQFKSQFILPGAMLAGIVISNQPLYSGLPILYTPAIFVFEGPGYEEDLSSMRESILSLYKASAVAMEEVQ